MTTRLDHIIVLAGTLEEGVAHVERLLGVEVGPGGEHPAMGTHNRLLRIGEEMFLEVLAVDPAAPRPGRPRWFDLEATWERPVLGAWVARADDVARAVAASPEPLGAILRLTRGELEWLLTVPADGRRVLDGAAPALIQWLTAHPAPSLRDAGCRLVELELEHPEPDRVRAVLEGIGFEGDVRVTAAGRAEMVAVIETPGGRRRLG